MKMFSLIFVLLPFQFNGILCLEQSYVIPKTTGTCGLDKAGPIVQKVTRPISHPGGMFWSDANGEHMLAFVDRYNPALCRYTPSDGLFNRLPLREGRMVSSINLVVNATGYKFVVGINGDLYHINITGGGSNYTYTSSHLTRVVNYPISKLIKGKTDVEGRLWYTTQSFLNGYLYKIEKNKKPFRTSEKFKSPGGIAWNVDNTKLYVVDQLPKVVYSYDFDGQTGRITNKTVVFNMRNNLRQIDGYPTDIVADTNGTLWLGIRKAGQVIQFDPSSGKVLYTISVPAKDVAILEFGTETLDTLFVGTTTYFNNDRSKEPDGGSIFAISGLPSKGFKDNEVNL